MTDTDYKKLNLAQRIKLAREMAKLSRRAFAGKAGMAHTTLQYWEDQNTDSLPEASVTKFLKALANFGIQCSYNWLINGEGAPPSAIPTTHITHQHQLAEIGAAFAAQIAEELKIFSQHHPNIISLRIQDDAMAPQFIVGETVAGICYYKDEEIAQLAGLDCIVIIEGGEMCVRKLRKGDVDNCYHLTHINLNTLAHKPFIYNAVLIGAAPILWTRRTPVL